MFARSMINLSVAPALAAILAITAMPGIATAQERPERDARVEAMRMGMGRPAVQQQAPPQAQQQAQPQFQAERQVQVQPQVYQQRAQAWGNGDRGQSWQGNRGFSQPQAQPPAQQQAQQQAQASASNWQGRGREPGQFGGQDRERGDRPSWQSRNPTYTNPNRGGAYQAPVVVPQQRPNPGFQQNLGQQTSGQQNPGQTIDRGNDRNESRGNGQGGQGQWNGDRGGNWNRGNQGQWNGDRGGNWNRGNQGQWSDNRGRNWNRGDRNRWDRGDRRGRGNDDWNRGGWGHQQGWGNGGWGNGGWGQGGWGNGFGNGYGNGWGNGGGFRRWDNGWRRDRRYDWFGWRNQNRGIFRGGFYNSPYNNFRYNRLSIGVVLGSLFYDQQYWINDPGYYHLPDAYGPYHWVRYYNDAVLVDTYTGEVIDVVNNFYW